MYLFTRKFNWVGYGAVAVAYIEQLILIRLFLLIQYMNFSMSIFHNFYIQLKEIIFKNLVKDPKDSPLKVVIATVALGIGADLRHIAQIIHTPPP